MAITIFQSIAYYQLFDVLPVWMEQHVDMADAVRQVPMPWFQSIDPLFSIIAVPLLFGLWGQPGKGGEPRDLAKIGTGAWICAGSNLILVAAIAFREDRPASCCRSSYCAARASLSSTTGRRCLPSSGAPRRPRSTPP